MNATAQRSSVVVCDSDLHDVRTPRATLHSAGFHVYTTQTRGDAMAWAALREGLAPYDRDLVLDRAAELFWANGFSATSLDELGATMGMVRPSIYNAFGDKETLFLSAPERYQETVGSTPLKAMAGEDSIQAAVAAFFDQVVNYTTADETHRGCLLGSVAAATDSPTVHSYLRANLRRTEEDIARRLQRAVDRGELPNGYSPAEGARLTIDEMLALGTRARIGTPRDELAAQAAAATETVLRQPVPTRSAGE